MEYFHNKNLCCYLKSVLTMEGHTTYKTVTKTKQLAAKYKIVKR